MPDKSPILDQRTTSDLMDQLRQLASLYVPEWTPPSEGDAGVMLHVMFARLAEMALERLNQAPDKNLLAFLNTMGVSLTPASPARAPLTFSLTPGTAPTIVPGGSQAATKPGNQQPAAIFETQDDLTVIPAQITMGLTIDPQWDRYTIQTPSLNGQNAYGFTPFVGALPNRHVLYLGGQSIFELNKQGAIRIHFLLPAGVKATDFEDMLDSLRWEISKQGQWLPVPRPPLVTLIDNPLSLVIVQLDDLENITDLQIQHRDLAQPLTARWVRATLPQSIDKSSVETGFRFNWIQALTLSAIRPDVAFADRVSDGQQKRPGTQIDFTNNNPFRPFGLGKTIEEFWISSREGRTEDNRRIEIGLDFLETGQPDPAAPPHVIWEFFVYDSEGSFWTEVGAGTPAGVDFTEFNMLDDTHAFTQNGFLSFQRPDTPDVLEKPAPDVPEGMWLRARINQGKYIRPPTIRSILFQRGITIDKAFYNAQPLDPAADFYLFGEKPRTQDVFYVSCEEAFSKLGAFVTLHFSISTKGFSFRNPYIIWQYWTGTRWHPVAIFNDSTANLTRHGTVTFALPFDMQPTVVNGQAGHWIRARLAGGDYGGEAVFVLAIAGDPSKGYVQQPNTGAFSPPLILSLKVTYKAAMGLITAAENAFAFKMVGPQPGGVTVPVFETVAEPGPVFYLGFDSAFPEKPVSLYVATTPRAASGSVIKNVSSFSPPSKTSQPLEWEYFDGSKWRHLIIFDKTNNLTESGAIEFLTPLDIAPLQIAETTSRYWIRASCAETDSFDTPRLLGVFLNTVPAMEAVTVYNEILGSSNGQENQTFSFVKTPVLPGQRVYVREPELPPEAERLMILRDEGSEAIESRINASTGEAENWVSWHEVASFLMSDPNSRHYTLDRLTGVVTFGALIPPRGTNNITATYRTGGGSSGNKPRGVVTQIKSPLPGVASVTNPVAAASGADVETLAMVKERGPQALKHRNRALTAGDIEWLARQAAGTSVARVRCLPNVNRNLRFEPGWATLIIVPQGTDLKLVPGSELISEVEDYFQTRVFIGLAQSIPSRLNVIGPGYIRLTVVSEIVPNSIAESEIVKQRAQQALNVFFHPLTGGPKATGWQFGRNVYVSEICKVLEDLPGVSHVKSCELIANIAQDRIALAPAQLAGMALPEDSSIFTLDRKKAALLAESIQLGESLERVAVKGFKEGDRVTKVQDVLAQSSSASKTISIFAFNSDGVGFPRGSTVRTADGTRSTKLAAPIPRDKLQLNKITVEDQNFGAQLKPEDRLTIFYPFPITVQSVEIETVVLQGVAQSTEELGIEPYRAEVEFPAGSILSTLDNRVRMPLAVSLPANETVTSLRVLDFAAGESLILARPDQVYQTPPLAIQSVMQVTDTVFLDENFLIYSGSHQIKMTAE